jgi:hypothetical protein
VPPRKKTSPKPPALTDEDVASLRSRVQAGEKPRVVVRTASAAVPAGTRGNVVRIGNPRDGEYIVVRLGRDEVPFAPSELGISGRVAATTSAATKQPSKSAPRPATKAAASTPPGKTSARTAAKTAVATPVSSRAASRRTKKSSRSRKALPPLVVTLRFNDGGWTAEASRGARRIAKASSVRPGAVKAFADLVDEAAIRDVLIETIESCRSVVEERAAALRAELQAAEASLKEYEARRR